MIELFRLETDRVVLVWRDRGDEPPAPVPGTSAPGQLAVVGRRDQAVTVRIDGARSASGAPLYLFEQRDYEVSATAHDRTRDVAIAHRDPNIVAGIAPTTTGHTFGKVNFGGQIGHAVFTVLVDGAPELDVAVDVFPTKLDYATDYARLVADVQSVVTGLVLEYLRATYQLGVEFLTPRPTELEWVLLLGHVVAELERALRFIAARPARGLVRAPELVPAARVRRVDSALRAAIRHGKGAGPLLALGDGLAIRAFVEQRVARPTLDTPEHRWLAEQLRQCRRRVAALIGDVAARPASRRRAQVAAELTQLEARIAALGALELFDDLTAPPPAGFASQQLMAAPGYREAYRHCMILRLGLHIEAGPFQLALKDVGQLYEQWCYLTVLQVIAEEIGAELDPREVVSIQRGGIRVDLAGGRSARVRLHPRDADREIIVTYKPRFTGPDMLIAQAPDILVTLRNRDWVSMHLVIDAKYRIDASEPYLKANDVPGPPQDALNVLHRYRDAIIDRADMVPPPPGPEDAAAEVQRPRRSVVVAIALFPGTTEPAAFRQSRMWRTIERIGIGAIPLLPGHDTLLRAWLREALGRGGWALSDHAPRHAAIEHARDWQRDAAKPIVVGVLRGDDPAQHLDWIFQRRRYYLPKVEHQPRQLQAVRLAIYSPAALAAGGRGAVEYVAEIVDWDVVPRRAIATPWPASRDPEQLHVLYTLGDIQRQTPPIVNVTPAGRGERMSSHRWSSLLALGRARELRELLLETEPEWRLLEELRARGAAFELDPERPGAIDAARPEGRTWFVRGARRVRYASGDRFQLLGPGVPATRVELAAARDFLLEPPEIRP